MLEEVILTSVADRVATLTFNRPDKLNALSLELIERSVGTLNEWSRDPEIGCIIVTGSGRAFCAGGDVSTMAQDHSETLEQKIDRLVERFSSEVPKSYRLVERVSSEVPKSYRLVERVSSEAPKRYRSVERLSSRVQKKYRLVPGNQPRITRITRMQS